MDPYCGWQSVLEECSPPPNKNPLVSYWQQSITSCPILNAPGEYLFKFRRPLFFLFARAIAAIDSQSMGVASVCV